DAHLARGETRKASDALERLVDIDAYDYRNQERLEKLKGKADDAFLKRLASRLTKSGSGGSTPEATHQPGGAASGPAQPASPEARKRRTRDAWIVQTKFFLNSWLKAKPVDRLQKIAKMFPGEEKTNKRLAKLSQTANWGPKGAPPKKPEAPRATAPTTAEASS